MSIFDINNPPSSPDSDLDSDLSRVRTITIADDVEKEIAPGDWIDVNESATAPDPLWGFSFQVVGFDTVNGIDYVMCLVQDPNTLEYIPTAFTPALITNNFRRV